jgi:hypothetical protein
VAEEQRRESSGAGECARLQKVHPLDLPQQRSQQHDEFLGHPVQKAARAAEEYELR